jgi:hypothetical protein
MIVQLDLVGVVFELIQRNPTQAHEARVGFIRAYTRMLDPS